MHSRIGRAVAELDYHVGQAFGVARALGDEQLVAGAIWRGRLWPPRSSQAACPAAGRPRIHWRPSPLPS